MANDILLKTEEGRFSLRVGGICRRAGKVLLHTSSDESGYSIPGGHVSFGEDTRAALIREFREELGVEVRVGALRWIGENFFPMRGEPCHQICFYYEVYPGDALPEGAFDGIEAYGQTERTLSFRWVPLDQVGELNLYPSNCIPFLQSGDQELKHFIYRGE